MKIRDIAHTKDLLQSLASKEIKGKYTSSTLSFLWLFINPLVQMIVLTIIFSVIIKVPIKNYPIFVFSGLLPWSFFSLSLTSGTASLTNNRDLIKKVRFQRILLPVASIMAHLFIFLVAIAMFTIIFMITQQRIPNLGLLIFSIALQTTFTAALAILLSSLDIYYRDISFALQAILLIWFYTTPIFYSVTMVPEKYLSAYFFNPMTGITIAYQSAFLTQTQNYQHGIILATVITLLLLPISVYVFQKRSKHFADWI